MRRKGSIRDIGIIIAVFLVVSIIFFTVGYVYIQLDNAMRPALVAQGLDNDSANMIFNKGQDSINIMINSIPFLIICLGMTAFILAFFIPVHPIFFPISLIIGILYTVVGVLATNVVYDYLNATVISVVAADHTVTVAFVRNFPHILTILWILLIAVQYGKYASRDV